MKILSISIIIFVIIVKSYGTSNKKCNNHVWKCLQRLQSEDSYTPPEYINKECWKELESCKKFIPDEEPIKEP